MSLEKRIRHQLQLILVLVRSLRRVEHCRRDFLLLLGILGPELPSAWRHALESQEVMLLRVPPLHVLWGVPAGADKMLVWRLTNYSRVMVIDSDVMATRALDDGFKGSSEVFAIVHHPNDMVQNQCRIRIERRDIGALFVSRPATATFISLLKYIKSYPTFHLKHYSQQTALACFFADRTQVLPSSFLYDLASPASKWCVPGADSDVCLRKYLSNCIRYSGLNLRRSCLTLPPDSFKEFASKEICEATSQHARMECAWERVSDDVRAVHWKGRMQPWIKGNKQCGNNSMCSFLQAGALLQRNTQRGTQHVPLTMLGLSDYLKWDQTHRRCRSVSTGQVFFWGQGWGGMLSRKCCHVESLMSTSWHQELINLG